MQQSGVPPTLVEMISNIMADPSMAAKFQSGELTVPMICQQYELKQAGDHPPSGQPPLVAPVALRASPIVHQPDTTTRGNTSGSSSATTKDNDEADVLDLSSQRRDSVETQRKTPSPYNGSNLSDLSPNSGGAPVAANTVQSSGFNHHHLQSGFNSMQQYQQHQQQHQPYHRTSIDKYPSPVESPQESKPMPQSVYPPHGFPALAPPPPTAGAFSAPLLGPIEWLRLTQAHQFAMCAQNVQTSLVSPSLLLPSVSQISQHANIQPMAMSVVATTSAANNAAISTTTATNANNTSAAAKATRPFKTYPRDPLSIAASFSASDAMQCGESPSKYTTFRKRMLAQIHENHGGQPTVSNPKMRRTRAPSHNANAVVATAADGSAVERTNDDGAQSEAGSEHGMPSPGNIQQQQNADGTTTVKDAAYYERRQKNNAAAKKSRDRRRVKEDEITIRNAFLEKEMTHMRYENDSMKAQLRAIGIEPIFK